MVEAFWGSVAVGEPDACWPWRGSGNGIVVLRASEAKRLGVGKTIGAARLALLLAHGGIPEGRWYAHRRCGTPLCCNPSPGHLTWVTPQDHLRLTALAGDDRPRHGPGRPRGSTTLSPTQVAHIRTVMDAPHDHHTSRRLALQYRVNVHTIIRAWKRQGPYAHRRFSPPKMTE